MIPHKPLAIAWFIAGLLACAALSFMLYECAATGDWTGWPFLIVEGFLLTVCAVAFTCMVVRRRQEYTPYKPSITTTTLTTAEAAEYIQGKFGIAFDGGLRVLRCSRCGSVSHLPNEGVTTKNIAQFLPCNCSGLKHPTN